MSDRIKYGESIGMGGIPASPQPMQVAPSTGTMSDTTEPTAINRLDPLWVAISAAALSYYLNEDFNVEDRAYNAALHADAMLRERDRRDREEQNV